MWSVYRTGIHPTLYCLSFTLGIFVIEFHLLFRHFFIASGVGLSPLYSATSGLLYQPQMIGEGGCGAIGGMKIGKRNRSTRRKPAPKPLCPPQIPLDQTRDRTRAAAVGSQRLTAWAMARPLFRHYTGHYLSFQIIQMHWTFEAQAFRRKKILSDLF
jgi:hypothetical protein